MVNGQRADIDDRLATIRDGLAAAGIDLLTATESVRTAETAVDFGLASGDAGKASAARVDLHLATAEVERISTWLAELRVRELTITAELQRLGHLEHLAELERQCVEDADTYDADRVAVNGAYLVLRTAIAEMDAVEAQLTQRRREYASLKQALTPGDEINGIVHVPRINAFGRRPKDLDLGDYVLAVLRNGGRR